jgi:hypothetical protein
MTTKPNAKIVMQATLNRFENPRLKCVPDQITGKTYALCLMCTDEPNERRISRHISSYYPPKELTAFMEGYQQSMYDNCFE